MGDANTYLKIIERIDDLLISVGIVGLIRKWLTLSFQWKSL